MYFIDKTYKRKMKINNEIVSTTIKDTSEKV